MTLRLVGTLESQWETIDGYAASRNLPDWNDMGLARATNLIWYFLTRNGDSEGIEKLKAQVWMPPKGVAVTDSRSPWSPEQENAAFESLQASMGILPTKESAAP